jgi:hypothetical protein
MQLALSLLPFGLTKAECDEIMELLSKLFESEKALSSLDLAIALVEGLVLERCQGEEARLRFFTDV